MLGSMRILVSIPSIPYEDVVGLEIVRNTFVNDPLQFEPPQSTTLDEFSRGLAGLKPSRMLGINIPNFPLEANACTGVAGPGKPHDELFCPPELRRKMSNLCGKYDKWRPYPAEEPLSSYAKKMATRFTNKRCRMFEYASRKLSWDLLFYVEHAPASVAHLDRGLAIEVANRVFQQVARTSAEWPSVPMVVFSPYGLHGEPGFSVYKNVVDPVHNWDHVRGYVNGRGAY